MAVHRTRFLTACVLALAAVPATAQPFAAGASTVPSAAFAEPASDAAASRTDERVGQAFEVTRPVRAVDANGVPTVRPSLGAPASKATLPGLRQVGAKTRDLPAKPALQTSASMPDVAGTHPESAAVDPRPAVPPVAPLAAPAMPAAAKAQAEPARERASERKARRDSRKAARSKRKARERVVAPSAPVVAATAATSAPLPAIEPGAMSEPSTAVPLPASRETALAPPPAPEPKRIRGPLDLFEAILGPPVERDTAKAR